MKLIENLFGGIFKSGLIMSMISGGIIGIWGYFNKGKLVEYAGKGLLASLAGITSNYLLINSQGGINTNEISKIVMDIVSKTQPLGSNLPIEKVLDQTANVVIGATAIGTGVGTNILLNKGPKLVTAFEAVKEKVEKNPGFLEYYFNNIFEYGILTGTFCTICYMTPLSCIYNKVLSEMKCDYFMKLNFSWKIYSIIKVIGLEFYNDPLNLLLVLFAATSTLLIYRVWNFFRNKVKNYLIEEIE